MAVQPTPTPPLPPVSPGIASQRELSPQENQALVNTARADRVGGALLDWAVGAKILGGYAPTAGAEVITDEGDTYRGVALKNAQLIKYSMQGLNQPVYFLAQVGGSQTDPKVALIKGPDSITIFSKGGITVNGKKVAQINTFGASPYSCSLASYSQDLNQDSCKTTSAEVLEKCLGGYLQSATDRLACAAALGIAMSLIGPACFLAAAPTAESAWGPCIMAVMVVLAGGSATKCPKYAACLYSAYISPNPPDIKVTSWSLTGTSQWINISTDANNPQWVHADLHRPQVSVTDDWGPPRVEPDPASIEVASGQSVDITATDCNGKIFTLTAQAPDLTPGELSTQRNDNPDEKKPPAPQQGNQPPAQQPPAQNPAPSNDITYQGAWSLTNRYTQDPDTKLWTCDPAQLEPTAWSLLFNADGTIKLHACRARIAISNCEIDFQPGENALTYTGIGDLSGYTLTFTSSDLSEVTLSWQSAMSDGSPTYCEETFTRFLP